MTIMVSEPPLKLRWQNTLQYCVKLASDPCSPDYTCVFKTSTHSLVQLAKKPNQIATLGIRTSQMLQLFILSERTLSLISNFLRTSPKLPDWLIERTSSQLSYMLSFWPTGLFIENPVRSSLFFFIPCLLCRQSNVGHAYCRRTLAT